jgi:ubiquinone/menaquinone biosynthesis C-methylase UbiE
MIDVVRAKSATAGLAHIHAVVAAAESLAPPSSTFELVTVGNGFHRLRRDAVAASIFGWVKPGGHVALLWSGSPWMGDSDWQTAFSTVLDRWKGTSADRIPAGWAEQRLRRPDRLVLAEAGFESLGVFSVSTEHRWTVEDLIGFVYSTSFLPRLALGADAPQFEAEMHTALDHIGSDEDLKQTIDFDYDLYRRPDSMH